MNLQDNLTNLGVEGHFLHVHIRLLRLLGILQLLLQLANFRLQITDGLGVGGDDLLELGHLLVVDELDLEVVDVLPERGRLTPGHVALDLELHDLRVPVLDDLLEALPLHLPSLAGRVSEREVGNRWRPKAMMNMNNRRLYTELNLRDRGVASEVRASL